MSVISPFLPFPHLCTLLKSSPLTCNVANTDVRPGDRAPQAGRAAREKLESDLRSPDPRVQRSLLSHP